VSRLTQLLSIPLIAIDAALTTAELTARAIAGLKNAADDGSLQAAIGGIVALPEALAMLENLPAALQTVQELPAILGRLPEEIAKLGVELEAVPRRLDNLTDQVVPVLAQLAKVLPALGNTTEALVDLSPLIDSARSLAGWVELELAPQRHTVVTLLERLETEVLPVLSGLSGTGADVVALRGTVERFAEVLDGVSNQLQSLPGAALIRRRAAKEHPALR
jgi:hypothetical protein